MDKLLLLLIVMVSVVLPGDLKLSCDFEPAYIPQAASSEYLTPREIRYRATNNVFCLTLKPAFDWKFLYGNVELTAFSAAPKHGLSCVPFRMSYSNEIGLQHQFSSFKISGGWMHNCQHQVIIATYYDSEKKWNDVGYDKVFFRVHFSNF